ncbi:MAG: NUDIX domain-containing protein [Candidatus Pacebacteria bacterium]|nr:NUDIX domain-containing protein [Candidatus Paceibacterota bacterium]
MQKRVRAIIKKEERCLFIHRVVEDREYWVFPGGGVEEGDASLESALIRECEEELGVQVKVGEFFTKTYFEMDGEQQEQYIFFCEIVSGEIGTGQGPEFQADSGYEGNFEVEWLHFREIKTRNILPEEVKEIIIKKYIHNFLL